MDVLRVDVESPTASEEFATSLRETGFAVLHNHPISQKLINDTYNEWQQFFKSSDKEKYRFNHQTQDGFFPAAISETAKGATTKDIKEFFQYYPWGQYPEKMAENTRKLYDTLQQFAVTLLDWTEAGLPQEVKQTLSMPLSDMITNTKKHMLRILHYPPFKGDEPGNALRAAAHGDINLITLLVGATSNGLQVKDNLDNWHDVPTYKDSIAVNIGDMLEMCTNGYYKSTLHRVINPDNSNESRLSMPLFLHPHPDVLLKENFTADQYLKQRLTELGVY